MASVWEELKRRNVVKRWSQKIGQRYKWISGLIYAMLMATISGGNHVKKTAPESLTGI